MFKKLNKEIVVKRTLKLRLFDSLVSGILCTILLYLCLTEFNEEIVEFMKSVNENNLALQTTLILSPVIILIIGFINIRSAIDTSNNSTSRKVYL